MKTFNYILLLALVALSIACDLDENEFSPSSSFLKIYDSKGFSTASSPIDVKQTADGGFVILGEERIDNSNFLGTYVIKVDSAGHFLGDSHVTRFVQPANGLMRVNGSLYFVAMDEISLQASVFSIDNAGNVAQVATLGNIQYPLSASVDGANIVIQSYNGEDRNTVLSLVTTDGNIIQQKEFTIGTGENIEELIVDHLTRTGRKFPFSAGSIGTNSFYFNGFYEYTFSLVFTDLQADDPLGILQGQQDDGGLSSVVHLTGNTFALSRFNFGDNLIAPKVEVETRDLSSSVDLLGNSFPELVPNAPVVLKKIMVDEKEIVLYGSNTRSSQIILMAYDPEDGVLLGTKYLGFSNPYEVAGFETTADGGLALVGTTYSAGRFQRICLFKLTLDEMRELVE